MEVAALGLGLADHQQRARRHAVHPVAQVAGLAPLQPEGETAVVKLVAADVPAGACVGLADGMQVDSDHGAQMPRLGGTGALGGSITLCSAQAAEAAAPAKAGCWATWTCAGAARLSQMRFDMKARLAQRAAIDDMPRQFKRFGARLKAT